MHAVRLKVSRGESTLVDEDIARKLEGRPLYSTPKGYVLFYLKGKMTLLHRWITNARKGEVVDHIFGDTLDNRRRSLRIVTKSENQGNRRSFRSKSGYRGVYQQKVRCRRPWIVSLDHQHRTYKRCFFSPYIAALLADRTLRHLWEIPGYLNYPAAISSEHVAEIMDRSMGTWMTVVFSKKSDGRLRVMTCRIMGVDSPPPPEQWARPHTDLTFVWEKDQGIRAIPRDRILCLEVNSIKYAVTRQRQGRHGQTR